jgi:nucleotide-binding universal stress UspA family protein
VSNKPIVVGYDGSERCELALDWALAEARARGSWVRIVHAVLPPVDPWPAGREFAEPFPGIQVTAAEQVVAEGLATARRKSPDVEVDSRVATGSAASVLMGVSGEAEMIVVGSRGLGGFAELLLGSTGVALAAHAPCPVVVVRPTRAGIEPGPDAGRVVVGVDGSSLSGEALSFAFEEAALRGVGLTAVHFWPAPFFHAPGKGAPIPGDVVAEEFRHAELPSLAEALAAARERFPLVDVRQIVVHAAPAGALVAASAGAELLVVGSRGRGGFASLLLGSVSHAVLHHAHCPVAVVRPTA